MKRTVLSIFLFTAVVLFDPAPGHAELPSIIDERYAVATRVTGTPFDAKLTQADFFRSIAPEEAPKAGSSEALFRIARSFRYSADPDQDRWQSASETETKKQGDCEDKAIWLYTQLRRHHYRNVYLTIGRYRPHDPRFHAWVTYMDEAGDIRLLDPTKQTKPWKVDDFPKGLYRPLFGYGEKSRYRF